MKVYEIMSEETVEVGPQATLREVARLMRDNDIGIVPVVDERGGVMGVVTDRDIVVRAAANGADLVLTHAGDIMSKRVMAVSPDAELVSAAVMMEKGRVRRLPIVEDKTVVGMLSVGDMAKSGSLSMIATDVLEHVCAPS